MRLRFLLVPMLAVVTSSCRSNEPQDNSEVTPPVELIDETTGTQDDPAPEPATAKAAEASAPVAASGASQDPLSEDAALIERTRQQQAFLADQYIASGDQALADADLQTALEQFSQALEVMPSNLEAKGRIGRVEALMGDSFQTAAEFMEDATSREVVRRAQARLAVEDAATKGDLALKAGDYSAAIEHYTEAQLILGYHPLIATRSLDEQIVNGKLSDARDLLAESKASAAAAQAEAAIVAKESAERKERQYKENKLSTIYAESQQAFLAEDYSRAENLARQILLQDPGNPIAIEMRDLSMQARHSAADESTRRNYREQWRRTMDELDTMDVLQTDSLVFHDLERWKEVSARTPLEFSSGGNAADASSAAVIEKLNSVRFAPHFVGADGDGSPLVEIADYLQDLTGVNFIVSTLVREDLDEEETTIKLELPERSVVKVLDIIADTSESLRWRISDGVVKFVTKEEMTGGQELRMYEVRDIIHPVPNFASREINIMPSPGIEQPDEDFEEREGLVVTSDALESLIRDNIEVDSWNEDPANSVRITDSGTMVVNQTPEVQEMVKHLLDDLREATGIMVDIEARFLKVEDNFLEDIGVDFRGLGQPGLGTNAFLNDFGDASTQGDLGKEIGQGTDLGAFFDEGGDGDLRARVEQLYDSALGDTDTLTGAGGLSFQWTYLDDLQLEMILRAVSKSSRTEVVTAPRVLVFNTARANIAVMNQVAYVQDFNVEIAQAASIADPIINVVQDGVILDVRPVVSADRRFILMELRPTVATLKRPIKEIATTLGSQNSVTIQLPELDIQRVRTTVPMPDGGTVMLGGLKVSDKRSLTSGVPLLNKIPVVRFLFERRGTYVSNQKLLILIHANIVIPEEHEPTAAQMGQ